MITASGERVRVGGRHSSRARATAGGGDAAAAGGRQARGRKGKRNGRGGGGGGGGGTGQGGAAPLAHTCLLRTESSLIVDRVWPFPHPHTPPPYLSPCIMTAYPISDDSGLY
jgi:hypothetical protein